LATAQCVGSEFGSASTFISLSIRDAKAQSREGMESVCFNVQHSLRLCAFALIHFNHGREESDRDEDSLLQGYYRVQDFGSTFLTQRRKVAKESSQVAVNVQHALRLCAFALIHFDLGR
jgi:hypothetical protein